MFQIIIGWLAATCHISGYSFQTTKIFKQKQTHSLSWITFMLNFIGSTLWLLNGVILEQIQPSVTNVTVLTLVAIILFNIVRHNFNWSLGKACALLGGLLIIAWGIFIMHLCDMYAIPFIGDHPPVALQASLAITCSIFTMVLFAPQLIKMFKTKDTQNVSYLLAIGYGTSNILWVIFYATLFGERPTSVILPIVLAGIVSAITQVTIITTKYLYERKTPE